MLFKILKKKNDGYLINDITHFYDDNLKYYSYQSAGDLLSLLTSWITMRVGVYLYTDPMICRHFVRLMHHISLTSSSVQ